MTDLQSNETKRPSRRGLWIGLGLIIILGLATVVGGAYISGQHVGEYERGQAAFGSEDWGTAVTALTAALDTQPDFLRQNVTSATAMRAARVWAKVS